MALDDQKSNDLGGIQSVRIFKIQSLFEVSNNVLNMFNTY